MIDPFAIERFIMPWWLIMSADKSNQRQSKLTADRLIS